MSTATLWLLVLCAFAFGTFVGSLSTICAALILENLNEHVSGPEDQS